MYLYPKNKPLTLLIYCNYSLFKFYNGTMDLPRVTVGETALEPQISVGETIAALEPRAIYDYTATSAFDEVWFLQNNDYDYVTNSCSGLCKDYLQVTFVFKELSPSMRPWLPQTKVWGNIRVFSKVLVEFDEFIEFI